VILYEMLTGAAPFSGENVTALMYQIVNFAPPAPSAVNRAVPEMLDFIVAKMLAKLLEERYQDARELARDLRECERSLAAPPAATLPGHPAGLAPGAQPRILDTNSKTVVMAQPVNRTREQDATRPEDTGAPPAKGVSNSFDSNEATQRLAVLTGSVTPIAPQTATQALGAIPRPPRGGWRRRDWLLVGSAALAGLLVAAAVIRKR
jgi:serine/threonine-protein kinase